MLWLCLLYHCRHVWLCFVCVLGHSLHHSYSQYVRLVWIAMCVSCKYHCACHVRVLWRMLCTTNMWYLCECDMQWCAQTIRCSLGCAGSSSLSGDVRSVLRAKDFTHKVPSMGTIRFPRVTYSATLTRYNTRTVDTSMKRMISTKSICMSSPLISALCVQLLRRR